MQEVREPGCLKNDSGWLFAKIRILPKITTWEQNGPKIGFFECFSKILSLIFCWK